MRVFKSTGTSVALVYLVLWATEVLFFVWLLSRMNDGTDQWLWDALPGMLLCMIAAFLIPFTRERHRWLWDRTDRYVSHQHRKRSLIK